MSDKIVSLKAEIFDIIASQAKLQQSLRESEELKVQEIQKIQEIEKAKTENPTTENSTLVAIKAKVYDILVAQAKIQAQIQKVEEVKVAKLTELEELEKYKPTILT